MTFRRGQPGAPCDKDEAWLVLDADGGATLGLGFNRPMSIAEMRTAAQEGTLADAVDWRPVRPDDAYLAPAGTVHALGRDWSCWKLSSRAS